MWKNINKRIIHEEVNLSTARSGGPGGQHVNKVETKVTLKWNVKLSTALTDAQKSTFLTRHANKISKIGELIIVSDGQRSQLRNKEKAFEKLDQLLAATFAKRKKRIPTKPSKASKQKRIQSKKRHGEKKELRKRIL